MEQLSPALEVGTPEGALNSKWLLGHITWFPEPYPMHMEFYFRNHLLTKENSGGTFFQQPPCYAPLISLRNLPFALVCLIFERIGERISFLLLIG